MQVRYLYGRNFGKKKFRFSCGCEISPRWQRNFVWFNESPRAMQRNFVASFGRLFVRTKDEIRRTARSFFYTVPLVYLSVYRHAGGDNIVGSIVW